MNKQLKEQWMYLMQKPVKENEFVICLKDVFQFAFDCYEDAVIALKTERSYDDGLLYQEGTDYQESNGDYIFSKESLEWFMAGHNRELFEMYRDTLALWDQNKNFGGLAQ